ncbi:hypothetical protein GCM10009674_28140 [Nesterenkonia xinjiangensis]
MNVEGAVHRRDRLAAFGKVSHSYHDPCSLSCKYAGSGAAEPAVRASDDRGAACHGRDVSERKGSHGLNVVSAYYVVNANIA